MTWIWATGAFSESGYKFSRSIYMYKKFQIVGKNCKIIKKERNYNLQWEIVPGVMKFFEIPELSTKSRN